MNGEDLIGAFRDLARDNVGQQRWSDDELLRYANQAEREAARRSRLIVDSTTDEDANHDPVCLYALEQGQTIITLHKSVIFVRRLKLASRDVPIPRIARADLDGIAPGWESAAAGDILAYCPDYTHGKLRLYPGSGAADSVLLTVVRTPLKEFDDSGTPEIDERHHDGLVNWMLHKAYQKPGEETEDPKLAGAYLALFEQEFGKRSSAIDETWLHEHHGYDEFEGIF